MGLVACLPVVSSSGHFTENRGQSPSYITVMVARQRFAGAPQRHVKTLVVNWLQKIIQRADLKGANRILIMGGHKDDVGKKFAADGFDDIEARLARHLNIEEHKIWGGGSNRRNCLASIAALGNYVNVPRALDPGPDTTARQFFIIHNDDAHHSRSSRRPLSAARCAGMCAAVRNGISIVAVTPPFGEESSAKLDLPPYNSANRAAVLESPTALATTAPSGRPGPSSATLILREPLVLFFAMVTVTEPPCSRGSTPCFTAFSTRGWSTSAGTMPCMASSGASIDTCSRLPKRTCSISRKRRTNSSSSATEISGVSVASSVRRRKSLRREIMFAAAEFCPSTTSVEIALSVLNRKCGSSCDRNARRRAA